MTETATLTLDKFAEKFDRAMLAIDARFDIVDEKFNVVDKRFNDVYGHFERIYDELGKHDGLIGKLIHGQDLLLEETRDIKRRVIHLETSMDDVQYSLAILTKAEEKDAAATINHEKRLKHLEKVNKIKAVSLSHLSEA